MSRRYGRNQKRAARRLIEQLEQREAAVAEAYNRDTTMLSRQLHSARHEMEMVRQALGDNFIGMTPTSIARHAKQLSDPQDWREPLEDGYVTMRSMAVACQDASESPQARIHFRVELAGESVGYAISEPALLRSPPDFLARAIGHEISALLVQSIRKARRSYTREGRLRENDHA